MKVTVVGAGYVGLVAGACFSEMGHVVSCIDKDPAHINQLLDGKVPILEPGLEELIFRNVEEERLLFSTDLEQAVRDCLLVFLCVDAPRGEDMQSGLVQMHEAARDVGRVMNGYRIIVVKSTVPVGTSDEIQAIIAQETDQPFDVVSNPDFLREGSAVDDFMRPDRVVIGCEDVRVAEIMKELYVPYLRTGNPLFMLSRRSAELAKYACNTMLAARISMMNELACLCEAYGGDITQIREVVATDNRIGSKYLYASLGFGGSFLTKDVMSCARLARESGFGGGMLDAVSSVNERQQERFVKRILDFYGDTLRGKKIGLWGVAFKARTDDIRCAPALRIIDALLKGGAQVLVYDPVSGEKVKEYYGDSVTIVKKCYEALDGASGLVIPTEWREFQSPDFERMASLMKEKVIFDGRNLYSCSTMARYGFNYFSIGRPAVTPSR